MAYTRSGLHLFRRGASPCFFSIVFLCIYEVSTCTLKSKHSSSSDRQTLFAYLLCPLPHPWLGGLDRQHARVGSTALGPIYRTPNDNHMRQTIKHRQKTYRTRWTHTLTTHPHPPTKKHFMYTSVQYTTTTMALRPLQASHRQATKENTPKAPHNNCTPTRTDDGGDEQRGRW